MRFCMVVLCLNSFPEGKWAHPQPHTAAAGVTKPGFGIPTWHRGAMGSWQDSQGKILAHICMGGLKDILLQRIQVVVSLEGELQGQQCTGCKTAKINQEWCVTSIFALQPKMGYLDIKIPLEVIKDRVKLYYIVQHRTTICTCMYLEAEVARKFFLAIWNKNVSKEIKRK